ncbi:MAG: 16S rRNA (cytosine(967)-C(5))-methyltransferase RsmB, partial [Steroidobacteraceae bacterium]|nr:16S rRNA (cytosine(967)-C(5))-methyltransferase RsmB [Steroidobacteraceae bacterium]
MVAAGRSADEALQSVAGAADRAAIRAIALGTLRWYLRLQPAVLPLVRTAARPLPPPRAARLVVAAHQIERARGAPEVSVHLAVDAVRLLGEPRASGLVNAVLRRFVAERAERLAAVDADPAARHAAPAWLWQALTADWGVERASAVLAASNEHPPLTLRVDRSRGSTRDYLRELAAGGHRARPCDCAPDALVLAHAVPVAKLPGFADGRVSVQDAGAQLAAWLLGIEPGMRVLDACAAPG